MSQNIWDGTALLIKETRLITFCGRAETEGKNIMVGKKVVHHLMMSAKDAHYVGGLVNGARIVDQWGDVGTELMVYVDGDISLFLGYKEVEFLAPVYVGDFMEYHGWIEKVGNQSYTCQFEAWKVATQLDRTDADLSNVATPGTAAQACEPPILCGKATGSLFIARKDQRGATLSSFKDRKHPYEA